MKSLSIPILLVATVAILAVAASAASFAQTPTVNASISGRVSASTGGVSIAGSQVMLVNASNTSEAIGNFTAPTDKDGNYQLTDVPAGNYSVFAWCPQFASGMSNSVQVNQNVTYTANVVLIPEPYYADIKSSEKAIPLESGRATITFTIYDHWMNKVGPGWFITTYTTQGYLDPLYGETDSNSQFVTTITAPYEGTNATINVSARAKNGTYFPLEAIEVSPTPTAVPTAAPSATAQANATVQPSAIPGNVTATPVVNATAVPTQTTTATAAPATPTPPSVPTPGFEILAALVGMALAVGYRIVR